MRFVPINSIKEGSYLAKTLFDADGRILLSKGSKLNKGILNRINNLGIYSLFINDEYSQNEIEDIIKPELRQKAIKTLKDAFDSFIKYNDYLNENLSGYQQKEFIIQREKYLSDIKNVAKEMLTEILSKKDVLVSLVDIKTMDQYTYQHSINVAVISLLLGVHLQLKENELHDLCIGAILHDFGKIFVPKEILLKSGKLTEEEYQIMKDHPKKGYEFLKDSYDLSGHAKMIILQHHEKVLGDGYPLGKSNNEIHKLARIVAIADVYDALTSDRPYRQALCPSDALEFIMANAGVHFDYTIAEIFSRTIVTYPEGTLVNLSTGQIGIVEKNNPHFPLRPQIKIIYSPDECFNSTHIDLLKNMDIVIVGIAYEVPC